MEETREQQLRSIIQDRKQLFIDELKVLPTKSKRDLYLNILQRSVDELVLCNNLGKLDLGVTETPIKKGGG